MSLDPSSIEDGLHKLRPASLDASLLARLDACAVDSWIEPTHGEIQFEQQLRGTSPTKLSPDLMALLESTVRDVPFPKVEKIVRFPNHETPSRRPQRTWWGAAAAVALTGALTALLLPLNRGTEKLAATSSPTPAETRSATTPADLIPASYKRGLSEAHDEGVIWQSNQQPHRVLKVVYVDKATLKDATGRTYQVEQPRVEYILVPTKPD